MDYGPELNDFIITCTINAVDCSEAQWTAVVPDSYSWGKCWTLTPNATVSACVCPLVHTAFPLCSHMCMAERVRTWYWRLQRDRAGPRRRRGAVLRQHFGKRWRSLGVARPGIVARPEPGHLAGARLYVDYRHGPREDGKGQLAVRRMQVRSAERSWQCGDGDSKARPVQSDRPRLTASNYASSRPSRSPPPS